jgi:glyoxylate/hydroxypyruvate reductase
LHFERECRDRRVVVLPDPGVDNADLHYVAVWKAAPAQLVHFLNLRAIFNLGAAVDALLVDSTLPFVACPRHGIALDGPHEGVCHVLLHHRQELHVRQAQRDQRWAHRVQWSARRITVGIMGCAPWEAMPLESYAL